MSGNELACEAAGVNLLAEQLPICPCRSGSTFLPENEEDGLPKMGTTTGPAQPCPLLPAAQRPCVTELIPLAAPSLTGTAEGDNPLA